MVLDEEHTCTGFRLVNQAERAQKHAHTTKGFKDFKGAWESYSGSGGDRISRKTGLRIARFIRRPVSRASEAYIFGNGHPASSKVTLYRPLPIGDYTQAYRASPHTYYRKMLHCIIYYNILVLDLIGGLIYLVYKKLHYAT